MAKNDDIVLWDDQKYGAQKTFLETALKDSEKE